MASLAAESIGSFSGFNVTNTLATTLLVDVLLIGIVLATATSIKLRPAGMQAVIEPVIEGFYNLTETIAGKYTKSIFPWFISFFIFIFINNIMGLFPGFGSIGFWEVSHGERHLVPLFRAATSDFNTTLAIASVAVITGHVLAIKHNGLKEYALKFLSLNPVFLFVGILELVSEGTKLFSLSFRLLGNIYAGEVVLMTISSLFAFIAPLPFLMLETIVALVQALVFAMLSMVFMSILITPHSEGGEH